MYNGTVKWFNAEKGTALFPAKRPERMCLCISPPFRWTATKPSPRAQKVTFETEPDPKNSDKLRAKNVNIVAE